MAQRQIRLLLNSAKRMDIPNIILLIEAYPSGRWQDILPRRWAAAPELKFQLTGFTVILNLS